MSETIGLQSTIDVWTALELVYCHDSQECMQTLQELLLQLNKGTSTVAEFGCKFKARCNQLSAIGHPVSDSNKCHWFL